MALSTSELTASSIAALADAVTVREVRLGDLRGEASVGTEALAPLASLPISDLHLCNLPWRPGGLASLRSLNALRLTQTVVRSATDTGLSIMGEPPRLAQLDVAAGRLDRHDLEHIGKLSSLVKLDLSVSQIGNDGAVGWAGLTRLRDVRLANLRIADERLAFLADLPALESLALPGVDFRRSGIDVVCGLRGLRALILDGADMVDIQPLFALGRLETLSLSRLQSPVVDLTGVGALPALRSLTLDQLSSPVNNIEPLREVPQLEELHLGGNQLTGQAAVLGGLANLQVLSLDGCALTDEDTAALGRLHRLRSLTIGGNELGDAAVEAIATLDGLHHLDLSMTSVTDACCSALATLFGLRSLDLLGTRLTGARLAELGALGDLRYLGVTGIAPQAVARLAALSQLTTLVLDHVELEPAGARVIASLPVLERLEFVGVTVSDGVAEELARAARLQTLWITNGGRVSEHGLAHLAALSLRDLNLTRSQIDDAALTSIRGMRTLERLELRDTAITDQGLQALAPMASLDHLVASGPGISAAGLARLRTKMENGTLLNYP